MAHLRWISPRHRRAPRARRAFTILELLIVIGILLALGGIVIYNLAGQSEKANKGVQLTQLQMIKKAMGMFRADMNRLPTEEEGIAALWDKSVMDESNSAKWGGPYLESPITKDMWGGDLKYIVSEDTTFGFDLVSNGPDGQEDTEDDISLSRAGGSEDDGSAAGSGSGASSSGGGTP